LIEFVEKLFITRYIITATSKVDILSFINIIAIDERERRRRRRRRKGYL
jgi:hypothetical protein